MRALRYALFLGLLALPLALAKPAQAQVAVGIGIGPDVGYPGYYDAGGPPVCDWGYYPYYPYQCAPYGYWGPDWFAGGVFIGAGPWYRGCTVVRGATATATLATTAAGDAAVMATAAATDITAMPADTTDTRVATVVDMRAAVTAAPITAPIRMDPRWSGCRCLPWLRGRIPRLRWRIPRRRGGWLPRRSSRWIPRWHGWRLPRWWWWRLPRWWRISWRRGRRLPRRWRSPVIPSLPNTQRPALRSRPSCLSSPLDRPK